MFGILFKWLLVPFVWFSLGAKSHHPIFVSVVEIEHNAKEKSLEVSCKIFTDDFEKTLRAAYKTHIDLMDEKIKPAMDKLVNDYVQKHLKINADGKILALKYLGYERIEEGIYSYFEINNINSVKKITVSDNILFEYNKQQINLVHVIVGGNRKSTKLTNPESIATVEF
jgi:hypothetical protein